MRQVGLNHHLRILRISNVHRGEILRRLLMGDIHDAPTVGRRLESNALTAVPKPVKFMLGNQCQIFGFSAAVVHIIHLAESSGNCGIKPATRNVREIKKIRKSMRLITPTNGAKNLILKILRKPTLTDL